MCRAIKVKSQLFLVLTVLLTFSRTVFALPATLVDDRLQIPRIDVAGVGALEFYFDLVLVDEPVFTLDTVSLSTAALADPTTSSSGSFSEDGLTLDLFNVGFDSGHAYSLTLNLLSQAEVSVFEITDIQPLTPGAPANPFNRAPVANDQSAELDEDSQLALVLEASDADGDVLTYQVVNAPTNGSLAGTGTNLVYTPNGDFYGSDSFTFLANDGATDSNTATVSLTINDVPEPNSAPIADDQSLTLDEDSSLAVVLTASDVDGDSLTYQIVAGPINGTLSGSGANLVYTPNADYFGSDSFSFIANDGEADSNTATVSLTINNLPEINIPPVAVNQSLTLDEDSSIALVLGATDADGDALTYQVASVPANGSLSGSGANLTYTPNGNFYGSDSFTFLANDGQSDSNTATVSLTINDVPEGNTPPVAHDQTVTVMKDTPTSVPLSATDAEGDFLVYWYRKYPDNGSLRGSTYNPTYTPDPGFTGTDTFTFRARDTSRAMSNYATVTLIVVDDEESNSAPVASNQSLQVEEGNSLSIVLTATDADGDALSYSVDTQPVNGSLSGSGANLSYIPDPGFSGTDAFTYRAYDGSLYSNSGTVSITVTPEQISNSAPVASDQSHTVSENDSINVTLSATDPDGDSLSYQVVSQPANGNLTGSGANRSYTPDLGFTGTDSFTFQANDGEFDSNTATVAFTVQAVGEVKAFPGAVGFGADATGGRGGQVIKVTNLNASGAGSLQAALNQSGPRIIVFEVSGVIQADEINIPYGNVTIAGQTAPGAGITIYGRLTCDYSSRPENIIVRHIRVRANHALSPWVSTNQYDALQCSRSNNLMFDHISVSGAADENIDLFSATNITVQYSTISRPDSQSNYKGLINGPAGNSISVYKNFFAHNRNRTPAIANGPASVINNVVYNGREGFVHHNPASGEFNIEGNYYREGPINNMKPFLFDSGNLNADASYYLANNYIDDPGDFLGLVQNPWAESYFSPMDWGGYDSLARRSTVKHDFGDATIVAENPETAAVEVLVDAGAMPHDVIDRDNIDEFLAASGSWGIRLPSNLLEGLIPGSPPVDSDDDGMADSWEISNGLAIGFDDSAAIMPNGYTAIENYINQLADQLVANN